MSTPRGTTLTPQQEAAVACRDTSVVLSSGAGCGKTHVLTERYLSHLRDDGVEVGQIVAITFTDRAAREMRGRIRRAVSQELRSAASDAETDRWGRHLRELETAQITTIHAFCAALLRQYSMEAGLDPQFDVLEEVLAVNLENAALTECLQALLTAESKVGEDLRQLVLLYGWRPAVDAVQGLLSEWDERSWRDWLAVPDEQWAAQWLHEDRPEVLAAYVAYLVTASPKLAGCLALLRDNESKCIGPLMKANIARVLQETPRLGEATDLAMALEELNEAAKVGKEKNKAWTSDTAYQAIKDALEDFRGELREKLGPLAESPEKLSEAAAVGRRFLHVAESAAMMYGQYKRRAGALDFQDLLVHARNLLRDQAAVREALRRRYRFLLVDELQDTDPVQMELVELLTGADLTRGKLFAVGDHKQSIYRFRKAEVRLFQELRQRMPHTGRLPLTVNFRSQPALLDFTNALLGHRLEDYEPLQPHRTQINPGPCVEFLWTALDDKPSAAEARALEAARIARRVAAMLAQRETLVPDDAGSLRPVRCQDIVLLFRAMTNVSIYENALRKQGIDYYLVGGRAFFAQQEIYDLLNLLRALENPQDAVSLVGTLRSPFCCLSDEALFLVATYPEGLWEGLHDAGTLARLPAEQRTAADRARRFLDRWRGLKDRLPIARLLGEVFADSGYDAAMQFEFLGDRKLANLWKLLDLARTFDRSGLFGLADFIARLGDLVRAQPREEQAATQPENADVVRLMSIHQAKGLEFPVVFLPDLAARGGDSRNPVAVWDRRFGCVARPPADDEGPPFPPLIWNLWKAGEKVADWHEDLRTLYVACTRAKDYLVLSASLPEPFRPSNAWMLTLAERFDLKTGECRDETVPAERRPKIRVSGVDAPGELPAHSAGTGPPNPSLAHGDGRAIAPIEARVTSRDVVPLAGLEEYLRRQAAVGGADSLCAATLFPQFSTEDGSDRNEWHGASEPLGAIERNAMISYRNLEFLLRLDEDLPALAGAIDWLWQDTAGDWHLLAQTTRPTPENTGPEEAGLAVRARVVEQRFGKWPKTARLYSSADKQTIRLNGWPERRLGEIRAALTDLLARPLVD